VRLSLFSPSFTSLGVFLSYDINTWVSNTTRPIEAYRVSYTEPAILRVPSLLRKELLAVDFGSNTTKSVLLPFGNGCSQVISCMVQVSPICNNYGAFDGSVSLTLHIFPLPPLGYRDFGQVKIPWGFRGLHSDITVASFIVTGVDDPFTWESGFCSLRSDG
jgi:hypothetical protein